MSLQKKCRYSRKAKIFISEAQLLLGYLAVEKLRNTNGH
jgi:hypothetical protein